MEIKLHGAFTGIRSALILWKRNLMELLASSAMETRQHLQTAWFILSLSVHSGGKLSTQDLNLIQRFGLKPEDYPILGKVYENLSQLPEVIESNPENQPDYVA
jgi:hypothetical protein